MLIRTHAMFEKYNVSAKTEDCSAGSGGEYEVQVSMGDSLNEDKYRFTILLTFDRS